MASAHFIRSDRFAVLVCHAKASGKNQSDRSTDAGLYENHAVYHAADVCVSWIYPAGSLGCLLDYQQYSDDDTGNFLDMVHE